MCAESRACEVWCPDAHALALAHIGAEPVEVTHHALDLTELVRWATATSRQERPPC